ncbi:hypothetical protein ACIGCZ_38665 [Streptomyces nigra]|uniref:hypothetical protein n=1 Tax=Streptomyces nigra TaxID=1827580 RepID=UPI0037CF2DC4
MIARETVGEVLAEPGRGRDAPPAGSADDQPVQARTAVLGSGVSYWQEGLAPTVLAPDCRRIMHVLAGGNAMDCRQLAEALGLERVPARVEGARSKAKGLASWGWLTEDRPGLFSVPAGRGDGS